MNTTHQTSHKRELLIGMINLALAGISVFLFEYWFNVVSNLEMNQRLMNFGVVLGTIVTLYVGKTYYGKGTMNNIKKILITFFLAISTVALALFSVNSPNDIVYPLSGLSLVLVAFYMLSLSASTLNLIGIVGISMVSGGIIAYLKMFDKIDWATVGVLSKWSVFIILFIGGVWPHFRKFFHGVTGVNKDGGGFGENSHEDNEDDGETEEE